MLMLMGQGSSSQSAQIKTVWQLGTNKSRPGVFRWCSSHAIPHSSLLPVPLSLLPDNEAYLKWISPTKARNALLMACCEGAGKNGLQYLCTAHVVIVNGMMLWSVPGY